jgi:hypothetical protein
MDPYPSREAVSCAAAQEFPNILWNLKVNYRVYKSPPLGSILISRIMALGSSQPPKNEYQESSLEGKRRPARKADNLTAIREPIV